MVTQDDSRERPESAVTNYSDNRGEELDEAAAKKSIGHEIHETTSQDLRNDDDDKEDDVSRGDTQRKDNIADDSRERPESAVSDDRNSQDFTGR